MRLLRHVLRHYPLNTPRAALLVRLPAVPSDCGTFRVKGGLRIRACFEGDVISKSLFWLGDFDPWVGAALRRLTRPGDTVLDVGANIGAVALPLARRVGPSGRVVCFEPFPTHVAKLRDNVRCNALSNVAIHELALSSEPGRLTMISPLHDYQGMARVVASTDPAAALEVTADTLDAFCAREGIREVAACKIDVEGHELSVLKGTTKTLERGSVWAFVFEQAVTTDSTRSEVSRLLIKNAYRVFQLYKRTIGMDAFEFGADGWQQPRGEATADFVALRRGTAAEKRWAGLCRL